MMGIQVFQILKARIGEKEAEALVTYVDTTLKDNRIELMEAFRQSFATKEDLAQVRGEFNTGLTHLRGELNEGLTQVRGELNSGLTQLRGELNAGLAAVRGELYSSLSNVRGELAGVKGDLEVKIADVKSDVIRWMFAFFVTMLIAILGLYFKK